MLSLLIERMRGTAVSIVPTLWVLVGCCTGCLEFDREIMVLAQPTKHEDAHLLLIYEGIHAASEGDLKTSQAIMKICFKDRQGFYYGHPLLGYF
jgi:hypothetical protein